MNATASGAADEPSQEGATTWLRLVALIIVNLLVALLWLGLLAWLVGRILTDRFAWSQWLWWIPTPAALIVAALGLLFAFRATARSPARRRGRIALWAACLALMVVHFALFEHRLLRGMPPEPQRGLTLVHWNMTLDNNADVTRLSRDMDELGGDIAVLTSPPTEVFRRLGEAASSDATHLHTFGSWPMFIASRLPILRARALVATGGVWITLVEIDASKSLGRPITMYLVDLPSNPRRPRMAMVRDARRMLDDLHAPPPDIVVGDFNIPRGSASIATLFPGLREAYDEGGHGYGASFPRRMPLYHIDHVLLGESLHAARYDIIDEGLSRHRAQKAWIDNSLPTGQ